MNATRVRFPIRSLIGLIGLVLALAAAAVPSAAAQGGTGGSIAVYAYACPPGFTGGDYDECRATPLAGASFTAFAAGQDNGVGATTDADGAAALSLAALGGGTINVAVTAPEGYESAFVACSQEYGAIEPGITFADLAADAFVTCEWYFVPLVGDPGGDPPTDEDGTLTITAYACPERFDGDDYAACREQPQAGVSFSVFADGSDNGVGATTDASGTASVALFAADLPGGITIATDLPAGYASFEVACQSEPGVAAEYVYTDTGISLVDVQDGAEIACAWFNIPAKGDDPTPTPSGGDDPTPTPSGDDRTPTATPGVARLPNTGTGAVEAATSGQTLALGLLVAAGVATTLVVTGRRRRA